MSALIYKFHPKHPESFSFAGKNQRSNELIPGPGTLDSFIDHMRRKRAKGLSEQEPNPPPRSGLEAVLAGEALQQFLKREAAYKAQKLLQTLVQIVEIRKPPP